MSKLPALLTAAAVGLLAACTTSPSDGASKSPTTPSPAAERTFRLDEVMMPCPFGGYEAVCGSLRVPENRSDPTGRALELNVVLVPAVDPTPAKDPVFFLTGGPGGASTQGWANAPDLFPAVHNERDIVLVDQRGTGGSNELVFPPAPDLTGLSPRESRTRLENWAEGALEGLGGDLRFYTSAAAADDLDEVRSALGYERIDLYGSSYGATLAQYYLRQHESRVRAVVLDSGTLVDVPITELTAARSQQALDRVFARCRADELCHKAYPDPDRDLRQALLLLWRHPVRTEMRDPSGERVVLTADSLAGTIHELLLTGRGGQIPRLVYQSAEGDFEPLTQLVLTTLSEPDPQRLAVFWTTECSEAWAAHDPRAIAQLGAGSYLLPSMLDTARGLELGCSLMPDVPTPANDAEPVRSDVPVLLLNGSLDPQDPPANVVDAPAELPNSLVIVAPQAHTFGHVGCMPDVVAAFLEAGTTVGLDTECVGELAPAPFVP